MSNFQEHAHSMTARKDFGDTLATLGAFALSAAALYFATAPAKKRPFVLVLYLACFLLIFVKRWFDKEPLTTRPRRQRFYFSLFLLLIALFYLVQAMMSPFNGWEAGRFWIFGFGWLVLAIYELRAFYTSQHRPELQ
jgi:hypothetical protein